MGDHLDQFREYGLLFSLLLLMYLKIYWIKQTLSKMHFDSYFAVTYFNYVLII
jgi:hypothetical protein